MSLDRLTRILVILLILAVGLYLVEKLWGGLMAMRSVIVVFLLSALLAYFLQPIVAWLAALRVPRVLVEWIGPKSPRLAAALQRRTLGNRVSVTLVYTGLLLVIVLTGLYFVPLTVGQVSQLGKAIPSAISNLPQWLESADAWLRARNIDANLAGLYNPAMLQSEIQAAAGQIVKYVVAAATAIGSAAAASLLILAISFYMMVDGRKLLRDLSGFVPTSHQSEFRFVVETVDHVFGGFARVQALIAILYGIGTAVAMAVAGLGYGFAVSWICALLMLVPLIGAPVAMVLPAVVALILDPQAALWVLIVLTVYQNILIQVLVPRIQAESMGLPTLLVLVSTLVGGILLGIWGVIFGVPLAAVIYALAFHFLRRRKLRAERLGETAQPGQGPPGSATGDPIGAGAEAAPAQSPSGARRPPSRRARVD